MTRSDDHAKAKPQARVNRLRWTRKWHSRIGVFIACLLLISAITGLALGWKKQVEWLQPSTNKGSEGTLAKWRSIAELESIAVSAFRQNLGAGLEASIERMDIRPAKNTVKVRFQYQDYEVQIDGISGKVLNIARRNADWIERIHDGSILSESFKLASTSALGICLSTLSITGLWLYFGPRRLRAQRRA